MSYEPLHHKYRPQTFADLVGQEAIATTLINAIEREKIAPAYLFTGPRGTGKTSSARILAKSLNCLENAKPTSNPCGKCEVCQAIARGTALDTLEIDAASNTGVDNIREIIERSRFAPVQCRYKVYVIDECHMLSTAAFNALLKTLEEPPERVIFVLATTDPQRVLSTIISRCQRFDFRRIPLEAMVAHLKYIATEEKLKITEEAIALVAQIANGGLRDAESLLDQLSLFPNTVTVEQVWDLVGAVPEQDLLTLLKAIAANDPEAVLQQCRHLLDRGREPLVVLQNLASFYLNLLIAKTAPHRPDLVAVTESTWQKLCVEARQWDISLILSGQQQLKEAETQLKNTTQPRLWLEVTLLGLLSSARLVQPSTSPATENSSFSALSSELKITPVRHTSSDNGKKSADSVKLAAVSNPVNSQPTPAEEPQSNRSSEELWEKVIEHLHPPTTRALLRQQCHLISLEGSLALVGISSPQLLRLHQGKVPNIEAAFATVCHRKIQVKLEVATVKPENASKDSQRTQSEQSPPLPRPEEERSLREPKREILAEQEDEDSKLSPPELADSIPPAIVVEEITPEQSLGDSLPDNYAEEDLHKAVEMLAKNFEGEIVTVTGLTDLDLPRETHPKTVIRGRPDPNDYTDEDDIPFLRSSSLRTSQTELQDCWELAANKPGIWLHGSIAIFSVQDKI